MDNGLIEVLVSRWGEQEEQMEKTDNKKKQKGNRNMKRIVFLGLSIILCAGLAMADRSTFDETKTQIAQPLPEPPVIDGIIDVAGGESWIWAGGAQPGGTNSYWYIAFDETLEKMHEYKAGLDDDWTRGGNVTSGEGPLDANDMTAEIYVGYDSDYLYVAVRVTDDALYDDSASQAEPNGNTWYDDSVEVFVDGDNSNYAERDTAGAKPEGWSTGGQYVLTIGNAYREAEAGNPGFGPDASWYAVADMNSSGNYEYEFRFSMDLFGNPQPGDIIGFDVAINDDDDGDTAENQYTWSGETHVEATYGNLLLGHRSYTAPKTAAPTIDGVISDGEYGSAEELVVTNYTGVYDVRSGDDGWGPGDHDYSAWIVHDDDAIYVAVDVTDDVVVNDSAEAGSEDGSTWEDDSVEIFFDPGDSNNSGSGPDPYEGQYVLTANGAWRDNEANNPLFGETDDWYGAASTTATGYQVEFKVTKFALMDPEDDSTMGFTLGVNDDDGLNRQAQLSWNGRAHNELSYGYLTLSSGVAVADWALY